MSIITDSEAPATFSFFVPERRKHDLNHPTSIINACYKAFDRFACQPDFSQSSLQTVLKLPLHYLLTDIPTNHWLKKYPDFLASQFFVYDPNRQRLRIQVEGEYKDKPRLCSRLKKQILQHRTIKLQPYIWKFIIHDVSITMYERNDDTLTQQFMQLPMWQKYTSNTLRKACTSNSFQALPYIPAKLLLSFWSFPMILQARTLWYRVICKKIPHTVFLNKIGKVESPICRLCQEEEDSMEHFLVSCPRKKVIWSMVLNHHFPTYTISTEDLLNMLHNLQAPFHHLSALHIPFSVTVSTSLYYIWYFYWQYIIHNVPFQSEIVVTKILSQTPILLNHNLLD